MNNILQLFIIIIILTCFVLLYFISNIPESEMKQNRIVDLLNLSTPVDRFKRDCETELVYAVDDEQCRSVCRGPGEYFARNGACVNVLIRTKHASVESVCDPRNGVLAYLSGDSQLGVTELRCMSLDPGVQPDDARLPNRIIRDGYIKSGINYLEKFPDYRDAECFDRTHKIITVPGTKTIRTTGVCVPETIEKLFRKI